MVSIKKFTPQSHKLKMLVAGGTGAGKTTLGSTICHPLFICAENGLLSIADKKPEYIEVKSLRDLKETVKYIVDEKPDYDAIVVDSLSEIAETIKLSLTQGGEVKMTQNAR
jgi:type IV secretory pathway ATPase VirB11/archaellum biosynthesis ATPase